MTFTAVVVSAYLLGAVPFGLLLARSKGVDLRAVGSGNIGATNTIRAIGKGWGLAAFALDVGKGLVPVLVLAPWAQPADPRALQVAAGAAAVLGHCFPIYLGFKGGKGVATGCGAIIGLSPTVFLVGGTAWLVSLALLRYVSISSIAMGLTFPISAWLLDPADLPLIVGATLLTLLILVRHAPNVRRLVAGTEPRVGSDRVPAPDAGSQQHG